MLDHPPHALDVTESLSLSLCTSRHPYTARYLSCRIRNIASSVAASLVSYISHRPLPTPTFVSLSRCHSGSETLISSFVTWIGARFRDRHRRQAVVPGYNGPFLSPQVLASSIGSGGGESDETGSDDGAGVARGCRRTSPGGPSVVAPVSLCSRLAIGWPR